MKTLLPFLALTILAFPVLAAPDAPVAPPKTKSTFTVEETARNPFWPIGWKPSPKGGGPVAESTGPEIPASAFIVSSITVDQGTRWAILNGKPMQQGQTFGLQMGGQTYQITLKRIEDGQVILSRHDAELAPVPLRRR